MHSLEIGGLERVGLALAREGRARGLDHQILVCDRDFEHTGRDFDPGGVPVTFLQRRAGTDLRFARRLGRQLANDGVQVLHAHNDTPLVYGALAGKLARGAPQLTGTYHSKPTHGGRAARALARWASRQAAGLCAVSQELADWLEAERWSSKPLQVQVNGIDTQRFALGDVRGTWRKRLQTPWSAYVVVCVARLVPIKRHELLLRAFGELQRHDPLAELWICGDGPQKEPIQALAQKISGVRLLGNVADVPALLTETDVFVLASDHEAHPLALMEAMAAARACIATDVGSIRQMTLPINGQACIALVPPGQSSAIAAQLLLLRDPGLRKSLGAAARNHAAQYTESSMFDTYANLWRKALQTP